MRSLYDHCVERDEPALLRQWDVGKNGSLTPRTVSWGSSRRVWWKCEKGHSWQARVSARTGGSGCPYCAGKRPSLGENDLTSQRPGLAAQWHPTKNGSLRPEDVTVGSQRLVWWQCDQGHQWRAMVKTRAAGSGCPVCGGRVLRPGENDLSATHPALAREWDFAKNDGLTPRDVMAGTRRRVWWKCERGHSWQASVVSRANSGAGCPVCAGKVVIPGENDLLSRFPAIAAQWHFPKNGGLTPEKVSPYSNRRVWWRCPLGHEYQAGVGARTLSGSGCPYCAGRKVLPGFNDLATAEPKIAAQWHKTLNGALTPEMVTVCSHKKVWWECAYGHVWQAVVYSRGGPKKAGCPVCGGRVKRNRAYHMVSDGGESRV